MACASPAFAPWRPRLASPTPVLFKYFDGKEALALYLFERCYQRLARETKGALGEGGTFQERLGRLVSRVLELLDESPEAVLFVNEELRRLLASRFGRNSSPFIDRTDIGLLRRGRRHSGHRPQAAGRGVLGSARAVRPHARLRRVARPRRRRRAAAPGPRLEDARSLILVTYFPFFEPGVSKCSPINSMCSCSVPLVS